MKLEQSFLFHMTPRTAWLLVLALLGLVALIEFFAPRGIWFGPLYLAVVALAAWSFGPRVALGTGLAIMGLKFLAGQFHIYPYDKLVLPNFGVRIFAILIVIGFIGMARKSCEREWRAARTDPLTGALNRQAFFEIVRSEQSAGGWSALIYADLDGLKRLNDEGGHDQGDRSIMLFAETIRKTIRKDDVFARMGGDEFVLFMKIRDEEAGHIVATRLHEAVNGGGRTSNRLKCSLGVLLLPDGSHSIDAELRISDELMYEAKKSRSGLCVATARRHDGELVLSPAVAVTGVAPRDSSIRKADRAAPLEPGLRGNSPPASGPRAAA